MSTERSQFAVNKALSNPNFLPSRVYRYRILGMALGGIAIAAVLRENNNTTSYWLWWALTCLVWPHLAYVVAIKSHNPYTTERFNLLIDSFIAGTWVALLWFNLLPAVLLLVITTADKVNSGIRKLWLYSQPAMILGIVAGGLYTGFAYQPESSTWVILSCLPILIIHTLLVSLGSYKLVRKVQLQNQRLKELSRIDGLTQLSNRTYWYEQVNRLLKGPWSKNAMTLLLIDIDHFKQINDQYGHTVGDEVLSTIAHLLSKHLPEKAIAGRLGGDEFAIVLHVDSQAAKELSQHLCQHISKLRFSRAESLRCTVSIGMAERNQAITDVTHWFDQADRMMYQAKNKGRNQVLSKQIAETNHPS